jgi:C-terminal processing protease CtpA/Prc
MKKPGMIARLLLALLVLIAIHATMASGEPAASLTAEKGLSLDDIDSVFSLVRDEYVDEVSSASIVNSALKGMREYLKKRGLDASGMSEIQAGPSIKHEIDRFNKIYREVLARNPRINRRDLSYSAVRGSLRCLNDRYSRFLDPDLYARIMREFRGEGEGQSGSISAGALRCRMLDGDIGYIPIISFDDALRSALAEALEGLETEGARGYIIDLRDNGGGAVDAALSACSEFLVTGSMIMTVIRKGNRAERHVSDLNSRRRVPLAILVNNQSASSSEILAGALRDNGAGIIVGTRTFGKASIQELFPLPDSSAVTITTARYMTPKGRNIDKKGITPDVIIDEGDRREKDMQFDRAKKLLLEEIQRQDSARIEQSPFVDAIFVRSLQEQYDFIRKNYGSTALIVRSTLLYSKGQLYDQVIIRCLRSDRDKMLIFDRGDLRR